MYRLLPSCHHELNVCISVVFGSNFVFSFQVNTQTISNSWCHWWQWMNSIDILVLGFVNRDCFTSLPRRQSCLDQMLITSKFVSMALLEKMSCLLQIFFKSLCWYISYLLNIASWLMHICLNVTWNTAYPVGQYFPKWVLYSIWVYEVLYLIVVWNMTYNYWDIVILECPKCFSIAQDILPMS